MLRSTSVVITTMRAPELMLLSPVSRPTYSAPCSARARELLVAQRLHRRRVEHLRPRRRAWPGAPRTRRRSSCLRRWARRPARCARPRGRHRRRAGTDRGRSRRARGTPPVAGWQRTSRERGVSLCRGRAARCSGATAARPRALGVASRRRVEQHRDPDGGEVQHHHRDGEQEHRDHIGGRGGDGREDAMTRIATRQPLRIARAGSTPTKLSSTRNTGSTKAIPMASTSLSTKSR